MLKESYKRNIPSIKGPNVLIVDVTRTGNSILSPSIELLNARRFGNIEWDEFERRFREEINSPTVEAKLLKIAQDAVKMVPVKGSMVEQDVYLICYEASGNCHRYILMDMIRDIAAKNKIPIKIESHTKHRD